MDNSKAPVPPTAKLPPSLPVPPLLPVPTINDSTDDQDIIDKSTYNREYNNDLGVELFPFGKQCLNAMNKYNAILNEHNDNKNENSKKEAIRNIFNNLIAWNKNHHFSATRDKKIKHLKTSDIRLCFNM